MRLFAAIAFCILYAFFGVVFGIKSAKADAWMERCLEQHGPGTCEYLQKERAEVAKKGGWCFVRAQDRAGPQPGLFAGEFTAWSNRVKRFAAECEARERQNADDDAEAVSAHLRKMIEEQRQGK